MDTKNTETFKRLESRFLDTFTDGEGESLSPTTRDRGQERNRVNPCQADRYQTDQARTDQARTDQPQTDQSQTIAAIEREFGFQFDASEVENITSVRALIEVICANATRLPC